MDSKQIMHGRFLSDVKLIKFTTCRDYTVKVFRKLSLHVHINFTSISLSSYAVVSGESRRIF